MHFLRLFRILVRSDYMSKRIWSMKNKKLSYAVRNKTCLRQNTNFCLFVSLAVPCALPAFSLKSLTFSSNVSIINTIDLRTFRNLLWSLASLWGHTFEYMNHCFFWQSHLGCDSYCHNWAGHLWLFPMKERGHFSSLVPASAIFFMKIKYSRRLTVSIC